MLFSSFSLKTKLNGQDQDRLGQDQDLKNMVLRPLSLVTNTYLSDLNFDYTFTYAVQSESNAITVSGFEDDQSRREPVETLGYIAKRGHSMREFMGRARPLSRNFQNFY